MKRKIIILYYDKSYKILSMNKINPKKLSNKTKIKMILIPLYDNPNCYIPVKPSDLYHFSKAVVNITYQPYTYDMEDQYGQTYDVQNFHTECDSISKFINAIYNCYKFRATSIMLGENRVNYSTICTMISIRRIQIMFYDDNKNKINEIDSKFLESMDEYYPKHMYDTPPEYCNEDRFTSLRDILFIPYSYDNIFESEISKLPSTIHLNENNKSWKRIKNQKKELSRTDIILYKIRDYEVYYITDYESYLSNLTFNRFEINLIASPICLDYDTDFLTSLDKNQLPTMSEKRETIELFESDAVFGYSFCLLEINDIDILLQSLVFFHVIISYINYIAINCYCDEGVSTKLRTFAIFYNSDYTNKYLITNIELSYEHILQTFLNFMN